MPTLSNPPTAWASRGSVCDCGPTRGRAMPTLPFRRDLHEDLELIGGERRLQELELDGVAHGAVEILELVGLLGRLGLKLADRLADDVRRTVDLLGVGCDRRRVSIRPVHRLAVPFDEARDRVLLALQRAG